MFLNGSIVIVLLFTLVCNAWIIFSTQKYIYEDIGKVPYRQVTLVLGTSKRLVTGASNPFFQNRIRTASRLYKAGKTSHFILSGDNRTRYYNEPVDMQKALMNYNVPSGAITLDYAGLRTLDSVVRSRKIFGQKKFLIVTQRFHSYRAVFISRFYGIEADVFIAGDPGFRHSFKTWFREFLARPKAIIDLYFLKTEPRIMGKRENLNI